MGKWINLVVGGVAGTIARYLLSGFIQQLFGATFPYGTLVVNLIGCFIIGFLASMGDKSFLTPHARILLVVGFCGAFTTFSAFMLETSNLIKEGESLKAFANVMASCLIGFFVFRLGVFLGEIF